MRKRFLFPITIGLLLWAATTGLAAVPQLIAYQGRLGTGTGIPLDTTISMNFTIYVSSAGGAMVWSEVQNAVAVRGGIFNVLLGSANPIADSVFSSENRWLGIVIGSDPEIVPRSRLVSVGYSHRVSTVDGAAGGTISGNLDVFHEGQAGSLFSIGRHTILLKGLNDQSYSAHLPYIEWVTPNDTRAMYLGWGNTNDKWIDLQLENGYNLAIQGGTVGIGTTPVANRRLWIVESSDDSRGKTIAEFQVPGPGPGFVAFSNNPSEAYSYLEWSQGEFGIYTRHSSQPNTWRKLIFDADNNIMKYYGTTSTDVLEITGGSDLAEPFQISNSETLPKGALVVIDDEHPGQLKLSDKPYDKRVAGVVSGAGGIKPGLTLKQEGIIEGGQNVALSGRVYCLATASNSPIKPGDLLTTSSKPGYAMKVTDKELSNGAIIGKAMSSLEKGEGLVLVLVNLQ